jgi:hypothetical protein
METVLKITKDELAEMQDLVKSGDLNLTIMKVKFFNATGRETTLNDEQITAAARTEDDDDALFIANMTDIETNGLEII